MNYQNPGPTLMPNNNFNVNVDLRKMNSKAIQTNLLEMGFDLKLINNCIMFFHITSVEQAVEYLSKMDGKWNHTFLDFDGQNNNNNSNSSSRIKEKTCLVCNEKFDNHYSARNSGIINGDNLIRNNSNENNINIINIELIKRNSSSNKNIFDYKKKSEISNVSYKICEICQGDIFDAYNLDCKHEFCRECLREYILNKINTSNVIDIECPLGKSKCSLIINENDIKLLVLEYDYKRYKKFVRRVNISKIPGVIFCPFSNCESYAIKNSKLNTNTNLQIDLKIIDDQYQSQSNFNDKKQENIQENSNFEENNFIFCIENKHYFCIKCLNEAHLNQNCMIKAELEFNKAVEKMQNVKRCPKCGFYIQKNDGCNHMTCVNLECKHEFCWICMKEYTQDHFISLRSSCYGLMSVNQNSLVIRYPMFRYVYSLLKFLAIYVLFPISILLIGLVVVFLFSNILVTNYIFEGLKNKFLDDRNPENINKLIKIVARLCYIFLGIFLYPPIVITVLFVILISPINMAIVWYILEIRRRRLFLQRNNEIIVREPINDLDIPIHGRNNNQNLNGINNNSNSLNDAFAEEENPNNREILREINNIN